MEVKPLSGSMYGLIVLFDMHSNFFHSALAGINDEDAYERLDTKANHVAWLAGSLVQQRFEFAALLGLALRPAGDELFKHNKGIQEDVVYPGLAEYEKDWKTITPPLRERLMQATEAQLDQLLEFPGMRFSLFEMAAFNTYREANQIGQIALWRRLLGYEAMKYM